MYLAPVAAAPEESHHILDLHQQVFYNPGILQGLFNHKLQYGSRTGGLSPYLQLRKEGICFGNLVRDKCHHLISIWVSSVRRTRDLVVAEQAVLGQSFFGLVGEDDSNVVWEDAVAQEHRLQLSGHSCAELFATEVSEGHGGTAYLPGLVDKVEAHDKDGILHRVRAISHPEV